MRRKRFDGLFDIPRAAAWRTQFVDDLVKLGKCFENFWRNRFGDRRHGGSLTPGLGWPNELLVLVCNVPFPTRRLLLLIPLLISSCAAQQPKPMPLPLPLTFQEQNWESLFFPNGQGERTEFQVKLSPQNRSAMAWSPKSRRQIHLDFTAQLPGFQPTQLHATGVAKPVLFVSGYDAQNGDGMLAQLVPSFDHGERIVCKLVYRGDCFGIARDMLVRDENHLEIFVLDDQGSLQLLHLETGTFDTMVDAKRSSLLARCQYLETAAVFDMEGNHSYALRATENKPYHGCLPSLPVGANVTLVQDAKTGRFETFLESDFKSDPLLNLSNLRE